MKARMFSGTVGRVFMLLCAMYFIMYVDRVNLSVAAPLLKTELHLSNTQLGLALSAFGYCYASFQIIVGYAGDRFGPRRTLAISGLLWGAGTLLTGFTGGLAGLVLSRLLVGLGEAGTIPTATRAITSWVPRIKRGFAQGFTHSSARAAAALTPPLMVVLIPLLGWRGAFVALGVVSLAWVFAWYSYFRDNPRDHSSITEGELAELPPYHGHTAHTPVPWLALGRRILPVTLVFFAHTWTLWLYLSWLPSFFVGAYGIDLKSSAVVPAHDISPAKRCTPMAAPIFADETTPVVAMIAAKINVITCLFLAAVKLAQYPMLADRPRLSGRHQGGAYPCPQQRHV